jgi:LysM repeat protein
MALPGRQSRTVSRRFGCQRTQAAMLSVALAIGAILPGGSVAFAQEHDQEREGAAAPEPAPPDGTADPRFDPGGETDLPFNVGAPVDDGSDDGAPVDVEPITDPDALRLPLDDPNATAPDTVEGGADDPVAPVEQPVPAPAPPAPVAVPVATPEAVAPSAPAAKQPSGREKKTGSTRKRPRDRSQPRRVVRVTIPAAAVAPAPPAAPAAPAVEPVATTATTSDKPARAGQRSYRVQPGDSLWEIASDLLGTRAANVEVVAESSRIYQLNRDRIGPDPDVLAVGTVLRLR